MGALSAEGVGSKGVRGGGGRQEGGGTGCGSEVVEYPDDDAIDVDELESVGMRESDSLFSFSDNSL